MVERFGFVEEAFLSRVCGLFKYPRTKYVYNAHRLRNTGSAGNP